MNNTNGAFGECVIRKRKSRVSEKIEEEVIEEEHGQDDVAESSTAEDKSLYEKAMIPLLVEHRESLEHLLFVEQMQAILDFGVERTASRSEIKKAYYKLALRLHPDKNPEEAKEKFQQLQKVISILGDEEKRTLYDQTGCVDEDLSGDFAQNLHEYFRAVYKRVTEADIEEFEANYRGSDSEKKDLEELYQKFEGNMNSWINTGSRISSMKLLLQVSVPALCAERNQSVQEWAKQISKMKPPVNPLKPRTKSDKKSDTDLYVIISQRRDQRKEQFDSMFSSILAKCNDRNKGPEPTDEEFEAARKRLESKQSRKGKQKQ
ncbi:hypothetical protein Scep_014275 [Stephania cephalantha]|uniref:J domain-containing protein n=1 Tax=Stephania cephalantha TaxID=152367 RepID=A0AAP0J0Y9_9MAGN